MQQSRSQQLFEQAQRVIPGGVNSPVRSFRAVAGTPPFLARGQGSRVWDVDGNEYIDYLGSWGPLALGHAHPVVVEAVQRAAADGTSFGAPVEQEVELAEIICAALPSVDSLRLVNSGTEACMTALRLARAYTGRSKIVKFAGNYHGHADGLLVAAGSGALTHGVPTSAGVPESYAAETLVATYNDGASVAELFDAWPNDIAAVIVEPVAGNMGVVPPASGFLNSLRSITEANGALLIFDEVITGFRVAYGGAQSLFGVTPDITTMGKIIGGGLPVGAYGGRRGRDGDGGPAGADVPGRHSVRQPIGSGGWRGHSEGAAAARNLRTARGIGEPADRWHRSGIRSGGDPVHHQPGGVNVYRILQPGNGHHVKRG